MTSAIINKHFLTRQRYCQPLAELFTLFTDSENRDYYFPSESRHLFGESLLLVLCILPVKNVNLTESAMVYGQRSLLDRKYINIIRRLIFAISKTM